MIFSTLKSGNRAEIFACKFLSGKGYKIISRNFRTRFGEIDIIALDEDVLCFVEVKFRKNSDFGFPEDFVDFRKQKKILKTAEIYLAKKKISEVNIRFDIVGLLKSDNKNGYNARLIKNAFEGDIYG
ncbi:MAG: YraN family protein [Desulforegulaceae bacterium]|jgi:putative endonuclease|nr:YraN family protein [Desulforegulaceae bacterium]